MRARAALCALGLLAVGLVGLGVYMLWPAQAHTAKPKRYCAADCRAEHKLQTAWNTSAEQTGSSLRIVNVSCSQKSAVGFYCIALMGGAGGRFCAEFAVLYRQSTGRLQVDAASRMPYCPGEG